MSNPNMKINTSDLLYIATFKLYESDLWKTCETIFEMANNKQLANQILSNYEVCIRFQLSNMLHNSKWN